MPYGGLEATPARVWWLGKHDTDRFVARTGGGCTSGVDADPALQPPGHEFAWPGSRLNEASPGELYNCRFVWWPRAKDTRDQQAYPLTPPARLRFYLELMVPVPAGTELLISYEFRFRRSRKYDERHATTCGGGCGCAVTANGGAARGCARAHARAGAHQNWWNTSGSAAGMAELCG